MGFWHVKVGILHVKLDMGILYIESRSLEERSLRTSSISSGALIEKIIPGLVERPFIESLSEA